ncbi:MAG: uroporphyrinogen decarboxylase family protein, partial [Sphaerochaetaceae bacterium]|nr:uroporphyrinogen decarboxylase family protein [Sphaerochaetaceae bacterium]
RNSVCMLTFISLFEIYCKLRPMDQSLIDLYVEPELSDAIIERILSVHKEYIERAFAVCGDALDLVYLSDDMGMQDRQLIGTDVWEARFAKPYQELIDLVHAHDAKVFYHTDGAAFPIIERMVGMGADVINPIQHSCPGMDREHLASSLQGRVVFHGAVDTQQVLPFGTATEVTAEVRRNIETLGGAGGYICAPCHNLQPGVPLENILALYAADRSW